MHSLEPSKSDRISESCRRLINRDIQHLSGINRIRLSESSQNPACKSEFSHAQAGRIQAKRMNSPRNEICRINRNAKGWTRIKAKGDWLLKDNALSLINRRQAWLTTGFPRKGDCAVIFNAKLADGIGK